MNLTIEQRDRLRAILPQYEQKSTGRKRADTVQVFEGILWLLTCGARWEDIDKILIRKRTPRSRPVTATFHRYFQEWVAEGVFQEALLTLTEELTEELEEAGLLQLHESFLEGCFVPAKKGAIVSA